MRFSKTTQCFYPEGIEYPSLPSDIVTVSQADYDLAMTRSSGETLDMVNGSIVIVPAPAPTMTEVRAAKLTELSDACAAQIYAGFASSALGAPHTYPAKDRDQVNLSASVTASLIPNLPANWTTDFWCADGAGVWALRPHTAAQIQQAGMDGKTAIETAICKNATLAAQVMAATTIAAVQAMVW